MAVKIWTSVYPAALDTSSNQPQVINDSTPGAGDGDRSDASQINSVAASVWALEAEIGKNPGEAAGTVRYRVADLEAGTNPITMLEQAGDPVNAVDTGFLYVKDDGGDTELFYMDDGGVVAQLTRDGDPATPSPLRLVEEAGDPTPVANIGFIYTKDDGGDSEPYFMDEAGVVTQLVRDGANMGDPLILPEQSGDPGNVADHGFLYTKDDGGDTELFYEDDGGAVIQLTEDGGVKGANPLELLEQGGDPGNVANTGFVYTKDVAGATELFYEDESGNVVQVISGNSTVFTETGGPTVLTVGAVADGQVLIRSGTTLIGGAGGAIPNEELRQTTGAETPGATVTFSALTNTPRADGAGTTLCGYDLHVFRNGQKMIYNATPADYMDYDYNSGTKQVEVLASGAADDYLIVYGSQ